MKKKNVFFNFLFCLSFCFACRNINTITPSSQNMQQTDDWLKISFAQEDTAFSEHLIEELKPIRENFKRINSISQWSKIDSLDIQETTEGGQAYFYHHGEVLEKIITKEYGETFQQLTEYYLLNGELSFVFEKKLLYNRPIYYDSLAMVENNDTEFFDMQKSDTEDIRSYFQKGIMLHQLHSQDCGAPFSGEYLQAEEKRILETFNNLIGLK